MQVMPKPGGGSGVHQWKSPAGLVFPGRRGRREQQHGPSATRSCLPGVQSVIVPPAVSDDRSEGELSMLDGDEDQGHLAAMDSGSAAGGPSPGQPGKCASSSSICALLQDLLGQGRRGPPIWVGRWWRGALGPRLRELDLGW